MIKQKPIIYFEQIANRCLDNYWNKHGGWDYGSNAEKWALKWAKKNFKELHHLQWKEIYKRYQKTLVQE